MTLTPPHTTGHNSPTPPADDCDRGSTTVTSVGTVCSLLVLGLTCIGLVGVVDANHRAATAADLAALAAADAARGLTPGQPCDLAAEVSQANGAELAGCGRPAQSTGTVDVRVTVPIPGPFSFLGPAQGKSRAGPPATTP
ncbi:Rv3654c family TadE-like protein [Rothia nasimurium]|uniref:Rv3654c family TadE-like protein n=1 Tax=Rothia nasimurium TaxID=85336 RepID=UPI001F22A4F7|nr:Rv3654c family TadE-like protein [Rothia nasimurium]